MHKLSDLQLAIMNVLWTEGAAATAEVHEKVNREKSLAYTTVATLLKRLEEKGVVSHKRDGRQFIYSAKIPRTAVRSQMLGGILKRLFQGDAVELVSHLVGNEDLSAADLERMQSLLSQTGSEERESSEDDKESRS